MGSLEAEVLMQLWSHPDGATPSEVRKGLDPDLAYTTVMTILARLWRKGLAEREQREQHGRAYVYKALVSEADLGARRMRAVLDGATDRQGVLRHFVGSLSATEEKVLRDALSE